MLVVLGCMVAVLGKHLIFRFFPAVAVLVFLVPVPGQIRQDIAVPLQTWTAQISTVDVRGARRRHRAARATS